MNTHYFVQFPGIKSSDIPVSINNIVYPANLTIAGLVYANPQFFWDFGDSGINTLCTSMLTASTDLVLTVTSGNQTISVTAKPLIDHPIHRPK